MTNAMIGISLVFLHSSSTARSRRSPERSHTQGLIDISRAIMDKQGVETEVIRAVDHDIATESGPI